MNNRQKKLRRLLTSCLIAFTGIGGQAQENGLRLHLDFEQVNGTSVTDAAGSGITASLKNQAKVNEMGKFHVLDLGNQEGYLDLTEKAGSLFKELDTYTLSMYYRVNENASLSGAGRFLWAFSTSTACTSSAGKYSAYRLNAQRFANSTGGFSNETGIEIGGESEKGKWMHILYMQAGPTGTLYLNGKKMGSVATMPVNSENFTASVPYVWIGRPPFSGDSYLTQTLVSDIRIYDRALSTTEIGELAKTTAELDDEFRYGTPGDFSTLKTAVENAEKFIEENGASCPAAAVTIFRDEMEMARNLVDEGRVNQSIIDSQRQKLTAAQNVLKATIGFTFDDQGSFSGYDTDRGFRHPGALHTEADFERIRQQLADKNTKVSQAYQTLINAEYAQSTAATYPVETIIRGGSSGQNYINAARGASIAYQNALRWKIDGSKAHAQHAVDVLMQWARTTKGIGGDSNYALAAGLYGYAFANAAELVRDYEGWSAEDFHTFKQWMINVWYPSCIGFLRGRNGTWENAGYWGQCPGHYWSNWGLCNVLAVMSIGILCDDVFIYNQGLAFYKYDMVGTFKDPRTATPILNDGLTEFLGNLVVTTQESALETGAYGKLGQMQESGRDIGHATMAAGLAVDVAHIAWNQGDDLFSYMDNRLAAGIEYIAAQILNTAELPWTNYHYAERGLAWWDGRSWLQTGPALGEQIRPYWGTVIGHYEGIKGVEMPFSRKVYQKMGIDGGGQGATSGGYDHMGYSVLMNTRDFAAPEQVPTPLTPLMEYNGVSVKHNELGGLKHTFAVAPTTALPAGTVVTLKPQLPEGADDTGIWEWNSGEKTKDITVVADRSGVWRATYTNGHGIKSEQVFTIAVAGDCEEGLVEPYITIDGTRTKTHTANALYGSSVTLELNGRTGWGYYQWENGSTSSSVTMPNVTSSREISGMFISQGGRKQKVTFRINVQTFRPDISVGNRTYTDTLMVIVAQGGNVTLTAVPSEEKKGGTFRWDDGSSEASLRLENVQTSAAYTAEYTVGGHTSSLTYRVYVTDNSYHSPETGTYYIRHIPSDTYLTLGENDNSVVFGNKDEENKAAQQWTLTNKAPATTYSMMNVRSGTYLRPTGNLATNATRSFRFKKAIGAEELAILKSATSGKKYWVVNEDGSITFDGTEEPYDFIFELIPTGADGIASTTAGTGNPIATAYYTLDGVQIERPRQGICIRLIRYDNGEVKREKILIR